MFPVEICIRDEAALTERMATMRTWLDHCRFEPSTFHSRSTSAGIVLRVEFGAAAEAAMFAKAFEGRLLMRPEEMPRPGNGL